MDGSKHWIEAQGRGTNYHRARGLMEAAMRAGYRGDWPAKLWSLWPGACRVRCVEQRLAILEVGASPLRVGFASDLHIGPTTPRQLLEAAFERLADARLDVLLLGGDYVFLEASAAKAEVLASLARSVPAARKLAVMGNHDLWTHHALLEAALERAGVEVLNNASVRLDTRPGSLAVLGLDDPWTGHTDAALAAQQVFDARAVLVLCHSPDGLPDALHAVAELPNRPTGLFICGHTHGGQIAAPWGPLLIPGHVGKKYPYGLHHLPPLHLYVSRGIGATELPVRAFAPPEVTLFELVAASSAARSERAAGRRL